MCRGADEPPVVERECACDACVSRTAMSTLLFTGEPVSVSACHMEPDCVGLLVDNPSDGMHLVCWRFNLSLYLQVWGELTVTKCRL
jgi:hypothetical protein